ncbi:MAG TPA: tetratricopeptide repeat protein [Stellaceae bacterium]|nr:tetratricopeptide repeat protein [Stellaceae bacterium]
MTGRAKGHRARGWRTAVAAAVTFLLVQGAASSLRADAAAGSAAFEKGDYVRAQAEWRSAAERGDPDAEFGLGMLYERGDGDLKQDYKTAVKWYEKAAAHGNIGAQYRLALDLAAGSDDLPADRVEAYKWILLAAEKGLATDVKAQLAQVLTRGQLAEAEKRAAAWKKDHAEPPPSAAPAATGGPAPATAPARAPGTTPTAAGKPGGCPGWPFPTLPCTEQFPALPGLPGQSRPGQQPTNRPPPDPR